MFTKGIFDGIEVETDAQSGIEMPVRFYRSEMIISYFEADLEPLKPLIPHERVHPIRRGGKKSVVAIVFTNVSHGSIPPYRSAAIAIPVTIGKFPAPSFLPLWFEESWGNKGFYIHNEFITTSEAYETRTEIWGYPDVLAEVEVDMVGDDTMEIEVAEEERIFAMRIQRPTYTREKNRKLKFYSIKQNVVCENEFLVEAGQDYSLNANSTLLLWGNHSIGRQFQAMNVGPNALETRYYLDMKSVQPYPDYLE